MKIKKIEELREIQNQLIIVQHHLAKLQSEKDEIDGMIGSLLNHLALLIKIEEKKKEKVN